jgi:hypothetical protein
MSVKIPWICDICGAAGEVDTVLPAASVDSLTIEGAAAATFDAIASLLHRHPVRIWTESL